MATLAEIRARLQAQDNKSQNSSGADRAVYPHWNINEGATSKLRYLPDGDTTNDYFWAERAMIKLPFAGIKGQAESKPVMVQVPCMEMWEGETCPILAEVRPWFKDPSLEELGRKYWKKRSYLFQGFVRESALQEDNIPDNPIRRFIISPQIFNVVKAALMDSEIEEIPTSYERGLDFSITKTAKGGYSDYSTSKWARKETALTQSEMAAIEAYGLFNLKDFLPKKPNATEVAVIKDMFEASIDGQPYDSDRWSQYFKPPGLNSGSGKTEMDEDSVPVRSTPKVTAKPVKVVDDEHDDAPFSTNDEEPTVAAEAPKVTSTNTKAEDILAMIRNRQK